MTYLMPFFNALRSELNQGFTLEKSRRVATMICRIWTFMMTTHTTILSGMEDILQTCWDTHNKCY